MSRRLAVVLTLLCLAATLSPTAALAQGGSPFGPLPPPAPQPTPEPTPVSTSSDDEDVSRETLFLVALGVLAAFLGIGVFITRDARRSLTEEDREVLEGVRKPDSVKQQRVQAKRKARAKGKAQRQARRRTRGR